MARGTLAFDADLHRALGDILGEIADPFEVAGDADGADQFAQVDRHRLAAHDGHHRHVLDFALQRVEAQIGRDDLVREHGVGVGQRVHRVDDHFFRDAAHFGDPALDRVEFPVVGLDGMVDQGSDLTALIQIPAPIHPAPDRVRGLQGPRVRAGRGPFRKCSASFEALSTRRLFLTPHQSLPEPKLTLL